MSESIEDRVVRYRKQYPVKNSTWYYDEDCGHECDMCHKDICSDTAFLYSDGDSEYMCEYCILTAEQRRPPFDKLDTVKQETSTSDLPDWIIMRNGLCYFCGVNDCEHIRKLR